MTKHWKLKNSNEIFIHFLARQARLVTKDTLSKTFQILFISPEYQSCIDHIQVHFDALGPTSTSQLTHNFAAQKSYNFNRYCSQYNNFQQVRLPIALFLKSLK